MLAFSRLKTVSAQSTMPEAIVQNCLLLVIDIDFIMKLRIDGQFLVKTDEKYISIPLMFAFRSSGPLFNLLYLYIPAIRPYNLF